MKFCWIAVALLASLSFQALANEASDNPAPSLPHVQPAPTQGAAAQPAPVQPVPVQPVSVQPAPVELVQAQSLQTEPLPAQQPPVHAESLQVKLDALERHIAKLDALLQNQGLLSLVKDLEALREQVARLRGQTEVNSHQLDMLGKRQTDLYQDLDHRLSELASRPLQAAPAKQAEAPEPATVAAVQPNLPLPTVPVVPGPRADTPPPIDPLAESKQYEAALNQFRAANYVGAIAGFKAFGKLYPNSTLASNAQYWIGYSYYAMGDYHTALAQDENCLLYTSDAADE